ncbi:MAG: DNA translocase FtsK 4TM domain-containing protein, partial [Acidobacteria bacterium]|nr:DNA translocase FtsK 4TM domain-containing protein [Acidobacteriota bacterium]
MILSAGLTLALAILSYHPGDSSAFYTSTSSVIRNWIGYYGATIAWIFVSFFGFAALLFPAVLLVIGWNRFLSREMEFVQTKLIGFAILTVTLPSLLDLAIGKVWLRDSLILSGGYLGQEIDHAASKNMNGGGAAILLITALLVGLLLATRISLASIFLGLHQYILALGRAISLQWARFTERRRKDRMKVALVRKHLEKAETTETIASMPVAVGGPVVREVRGAGKFQIRKVTKADLRKAAEELSKQEQTDPFELYAVPSPAPAPRPAPPVAREPREVREARQPREVPEPREARPPIRKVVEPVPEPDPDFEDPLFDDSPIAPARPKPQIPRPAARRPKEPAPREARPGNDLLPPVDLLTAGPKQNQINDEVHKQYLEVGHLIEDRCREFSVEGEVTAYHPGPVVTTFEFKPSAGVKYAKVVNLGDDLALALKAESIRIERISGSSTVGIEVPNRKRELITLRDIIDTDAFVQSQSHLTLALGKDIHGDAMVTDLAKMPHLLVAGATGAGKSVGLNSMIVSLLYKALPKHLRMLMIDPKMVELKIYEDIPHLLHPIVTDPKLASNALIWAVQEMENRYRTLAECGVRNIDQYNALLKDPEALRRARKSEEDAPVPEPLQ